MNTNRGILRSLLIGLLSLAIFGCAHHYAPVPPARDITERGGSFVYPDDVILDDTTLEEFGDDPRDLPPPYIWGEEISGRKLTVAAWNVQNLGYPPRGDLGFSRLVQVIDHFDVVVIVEVMTDEGALRLLRELQNDEPDQDWGMLVSRKQARPGEHANSREAVLYVWKRDRVLLLHRGGFIDPQMPDMKRSPYWAWFRARTETPHDDVFDFVLLSVHTNPSGRTPVTPAPGGTAGEIRYLGGAIHDWARDFVDNPRTPLYGLDPEVETDIIVGGDFNAGIQPAGPPAIQRTAADREFAARFGEQRDGPPGLSKAIVGTRSMRDGGRSNDNLMWREPTNEDFADFRGVIRFTDAEKQVSDHWPVFALFWLDRDNSD